MTRAWLYDGSSGVRHEVEVVQDGPVLRIDYAGAPLEDVMLDELSVADRGSAGLTLRRSGNAGWRLKLPAPVDPELDRLFPRGGGYGGWIDRVGLPRALAVFVAGSALVLAGGYFAPTLLAPLVPPSVEKAYGEALVGDFGGKYCSTPLGDAALKRLVASLDPKPGELNVRVVDAPIVNAAALPAGNIVLFDKLFEVVESPEELAGILAHEIAHVRRRHITAALIREFGVGIFASALGGTTAGRVDGFVALTFTRRAEQDADATAIATLNRAHISPAPTANFFRRLKKAETDLGRFEPAMAYLSSHPLSGDRAQRFTEAAHKGEAYRPALSSREWTELRAICSSRPPS
ncbi:M48 family metallopeptidase [Sphingomonas sp. ID1715]|uniref:M48 family metallopeptidase n=1 Tax=Sphingomonas sp. ID1715 TaxID=1656898 RepID=UPI0014886E07|nr:M48 family metallopeptidase [Sphingomonas sp. ID1715]NNM77478.1 M48 family metallopeptidase [Sphingomonas sp. ID1715]